MILDDLMEDLLVCISSHAFVCLALLYGPLVTALPTGLLRQLFERLGRLKGLVYSMRRYASTVVPEDARVEW